MPQYAPVIDLATLNGSNGFRIEGIDAGDQSGFPVASAGDVNGDGFADILIGAAGGDPGGDANAGESYVVFGQASGFAAALDLSTLNGTNGFRLDGIDVGDASGFSVASPGDVNGDGFDDIIIGAYGAGGSDGESYVVFGKASGFAAALDLSTLNGTNGFRLDGIDTGDESGFSVSSAGDINGDGFDDILIGAPGGDRAGPYGFSSGESYVVFGQATGFAAALDLSTLNGSNGFRLDGIGMGYQDGHAVSSAGDVNGDGFDDILIGADGIHSTVRRILLGPEKPRFANRAFRGLIPAEKVSDIPRESTAWLGPRGHFVHYFVSAGRYLNFVGHKEQDTEWLSESWSEPGKVSDLRAAYAGWHPQVQRIIDAVDETFIWAVLDRPPIDRWSHGRITMMGDSCHPMLPYMGQGGAQAIEDAVAITACLLRCGDDLDAALKLYEAVRLPRAAKIQDGSWANRTRFHMPDGPTQIERDAQMAKGPIDSAYVHVGWVYSHDAGALDPAGPATAGR